MDNATMQYFGLLYNLSLTGLAVQFAALMSYSLLLFYVIIRRRDTVVVLDHWQLLKSTFVANVANLIILHIALWLSTLGVLGLIVAVLAINDWITGRIFRYSPLRVLVYRYDRGRSLRDTAMGPAEAFNCNWPLIPRATGFALIQVFFFAYVASMCLHSLKEANGQAG